MLSRTLSPPLALLKPSWPLSAWLRAPPLAVFITRLPVTRSVRMPPLAVCSRAAPSTSSISIRPLAVFATNLPRTRAPLTRPLTDLALTSPSTPRTSTWPRVVARSRSQRRGTTTSKLMRKPAGPSAPVTADSMISPRLSRKLDRPKSNASRARRTCRSMLSGRARISISPCGL